MNKLMTAIIGTVAALAIAGQVFAGTMSIKLEAPKSPTNLTSLNLTFVVLDYSSTGGAITAKCYKKGPSDGAFSQFDGDKAISAGGNTATCVANLNTEGTYQFYVTATNTAAETVQSDTRSVEFKTSGPGTPTSYSKSRVNACDYKISFHTADDSGKTVKVEVYRSSNTTFTADDGSRVDTITIGSNADGSSTTTPPNCNTDYFFAVRAFDSSGNGSGLIGDSVTTTTTTTTVTGASGTTGAAGAIPAGTNGNVLGASNGPLEGPTGTSGGVLGEASASGTPTAAPTPTPAKPGGLFTPRNAGIGGGLLILLILLFILFK